MRLLVEEAGSKILSLPVGYVAPERAAKDEGPEPLTQGSR
jgi:hypothetical protein